MTPAPGAKERPVESMAAKPPEDKPVDLAEVQKYVVTAKNDLEAHFKQAIGAQDAIKVNRSPELNASLKTIDAQIKSAEIDALKEVVKIVEGSVS